MKRGRIALAVVLPLLILLAGRIGAYREKGRSAESAEARLSAREAVLSRRLASLLEEAQAAAGTARDRGPASVEAELSPALAPRLEGAGVVRAGRFESWAGSPAEAAMYPDPGSASVLSRGIRTSLLVRSDPDGASRTGVASFVLEIHAGGIRAQDLLPADAGGITARWELAALPPQVKRRFDARPPASLTVRWDDLHAHPLATLILEEGLAGATAARSAATAAAWAGLAFAVLIGFALARRGGEVVPERMLAVALGIVAARFALRAGRTLEELLPRELSSPSLYGRSDWLGLCASPAALFATAVAFYLLVTILTRFLASLRERGRRWAVIPQAALVVFGTAVILALAVSLARDARVRVPRLDPGSPGSLLLALAAACFIVGSAEAAATLVGRRGRLAVAAMLVPFSLLFLAGVHRTFDHMLDERLRSEFAPLVLEQSARRQVALTAAVGEAAGSAALSSALKAPHGPDDTFLAYELWMDSDLFHEGFASSFDVYDADGARRSHFGFALPQFGGAREVAARGLSPGGGPFVAPETVPAGASHLRVVHAESAVTDPSGAQVGRVVGHVLEDPSNLPFLPGSAPYIEALGGHPSPTYTTLADAPDYVLFDEDGRVEVSTLRQPPAATPELRRTAAAGRRAEVVAGDTRYRALPLADGRRLHLLLMPAQTALDALADEVRLLLIALLVLAATALAATVFGPGGVDALLDVVRGSFYRKLLAGVLVASVVPLVALSIFLRGYIDRRGEATLADSAAALAGAARRVVEDYQSVGEDDPTLPRLKINDDTLWWLRRVVGQEIHVYEDGVLAATSKPELFDSVLVRKRLPGEVERDVIEGGQPVVVRHEHLGAIPLPVAYARIEERGGPRDAVIAVPLVLEQRASARAVDRLVEMLLLLTTALVVMLAGSAAVIARSVADPVRKLADATRRIAGGDYGTRLPPKSRDEVGSLVQDFNRMAGALADQRADLTRRRDYIEALLRHATTGVVSTDADLKIVTINPAAETLLAGNGTPPRPGEALVAALRRSEALKPLALALADPGGATAVPIEVDVEGDDGPLRLRFVRVPLPDPAGGAAGSLVLLDDVTSLMKSNQLAAWAEMARAIAHEIKNPLTPIQLSAEHVRELLRDRGIVETPEIEACLETIVRKVRELRDISSAFSTYAKLPDLVFQRVDPAGFLRGVIAPYRTAPPPGIGIEERYTETGPILADPVVLARAVVNLIENAIQAMPTGGTLTIAGHPGENGEVVLSVSDTGEGLTAEARARLFEPYFSTKSSGTGLGLAIVRRVVLGHHGTIDVLSTPGAGTTMALRLRAAPAS